MTRRLAVLAFALFVFHTATARAAGPALGIADDRILMAGGAQADQAVQAWKQLGVQDVRILVLWGTVAPDPQFITRPPGFDASDPGSPGYDWAALDGAVNRVVAAGIKPILTITGPGPLWASQDVGRDDPRWEPDPDAYSEFAGAVAQRYGDRVDTYILWNEPNLGTWLRPQYSCAKTCTPEAPDLYRALVRAAYPSIHAADPGARVLIGAMSSRGESGHSTNSSEHPLTFLRELGCVSASYKRLSGGRCKHFQPATGDGFAYHPHGILNAPDKPFPDPDDANLASLGRLESALDKLQKAGRLRATTQHFGIYIDEYGYQTDPPDKVLGVSPATQDRWLQQAAYEAWRDPRVKLFTQYLWQDEPAVGGTYSGWQSGLLYANGKAKPALAHFGTPFALDARRSRLWGQVRSRDTRTVSVQRRLTSHSQWRTVATRTTDSQGYWSWTTRLIHGATYRFRAAGATSASVRRE